MENESQRIAHEVNRSIENLEGGVAMEDDDDDDDCTVNSGRQNSQDNYGGDARSQLKILN